MDYRQPYNAYGPLYHNTYIMKRRRVFFAEKLLKNSGKFQ